MRRLVFLMLLLTGCETLSPFAVPDEKAVVTASQLDPSAHAAAERLDRVSRQIIYTNPFLASTPAFGFVGTKTTEVYHQNADSVFCTDGLIAKCKTDDELAAILCLELASIAAEQRNMNRMGLSATGDHLPGFVGESDPDEPELAGGESVGAASTSMATRRTIGSTDSTAVAREFHRNAGYKPEAFDAIRSIRTNADESKGTAKQMIGSKQKPTWSR